MTKKLRLVCVITSIALLVSVLAGTGAYVIVNHIKALLDATTRDNIGNILKDSNTVNYDTYQLLLTKLGSYTDSTKKTQSEINSGKPVVFQMGTVNGNSVEWQVVYQYGDIITVWMTNLYTVSVHNTTSSFVKYPSATIRTNVQNIYNAQKTSYGVIDSITVSPNDTTKMPLAYIDAQAVDGNYGYSCNTGDNTLANVSDKYWLPSNYEVFSLWGLGDDDRGYADGSNTSSNITCLDGTQGNTSNNIYTSSCWLCSGSL